MDNQQALTLIKALVAAFPRQTMREDTIKVYVKTLSDLDYKTAESVIMRIIRTKIWFPTVAEIRADCVEVIHDIPHAEEAMTLLKRAAGGNDYKVLCENTTLKQAVDSVGWGAYTTSERPDIMARQIKEAYDKIRGRTVLDLANQPGVGSKPELAKPASDYKYKEIPQDTQAFDFLEEGTECTPETPDR